MIPSPSSLRHRITLSGVLLITVLVLALDVFVYLNLRDRMLSELDRVLVARAGLVTELARDLDPLPLASRLQEAGLRAIVRSADGDEFLSGGAPPFDEIPAGGSGADLASRIVPLGDDIEVVVLASRGGIDDTLRRLLVLEVLGSVAVVGLAAVALSRISRRVLRPIGEVATTARRIADGELDRRLESRERDEELAELVVAFNDMVDELEAALAQARASDEASRRFLADAAHQLRTPAAGIRASVGTMLRTRSDAERERLLDNLASETARMSRLLSSLLRVARLDAGERPQTVVTDLTELARGVVERHRMLGPSLEFAVSAPDGPCAAEVDPAAIEEALDNLVDNAARNASGRVHVRVADDDRAVVLVVTDDGPAVPAGDEERIFERFVTLAEGRGGSGLGLPIARGVAEAHGGTLAYREGGFVLRLPASA